jgi:GTP-binding protein EngB required for normal cell division/uncharacterized protein (DUF697 family)
LIAIIGQTGSGKSTLIRRLLGLSPDDPNGPAVGRSVTECTKKSTEYRKEGTGLVYVDLPGVGSIRTTCAFQTPEEKDAYCKSFRLQTIDYFLLVSQNKFTEQENLLAEYITQKLKKKFLFVQTKMDLLRKEFGNQRIEDTRGFEAVKRMIRTDIQKQLGRNTAERIFLVSNDVIKVGPDEQQRLVYDNSSDYEFDILMKQIQDDMLGENGLNSLKGQAFIRATGAISKNAIQAKANALRNQSWSWSILSGVIGAVPIPGVSLACDSALVISLATDYFCEFGLNHVSFLGDGTPAEKMKNLVKVMSASMGPRVAATLTTAVGLSFIEEGSKAIPIAGAVIGSVLGAGVSFTSTCIILHQLIDFCEIEALKFIHQD